MSTKPTSSDSPSEGQTLAGHYRIVRLHRAVAIKLLSVISTEGATDPAAYERIVGRKPT